jgi:Na+/melibiose symporter-like transporter
VAAVWTVFVWAVFIKNLFGADHDTSFIIVHLMLAVISIGFAFAIWQVAARNRREAKEQAHNH